MAKPTKQQRQAARRHAHARRINVNGRMIAAHLRPDQHGTRTAYDYHGCRCDFCRRYGTVPNDPQRRAENRRTHMDRRILVDGALYAAELPADQHGTPHGNDYYGCQCDPCMEAARERRRRDRGKR